MKIFNTKTIGVKRSRIHGIAIKFFILSIFSSVASCEELKTQSDTDRAYFIQFEKLSWVEVFNSSGTENWEEKWFIDGTVSAVTNNDKGMEFDLREKEGKSNLGHAVLWTKESFKGDVKIEYEFTRLDSAIKFVNILFIQATGSGQGEYDKNIYQWANLRSVPDHQLYFNHMNTYHISYAAYDYKSNDPENDYIRARRYMPETNNGLKGTELKPDYKWTGLFKTGIPHKIVVIKKGNDLFMRIRNNEKDFLCHWKNNSLPPIMEGRIGLRHMFSRASRYRNFRVSILQKTKSID